MADYVLSSPVERRVRKSYTMFTDQYPTEKTMYINVGYWPPGCSSLDEACEALADALADAVGMRAGDRVLDAGFGYADQDMHWLETRKPALIAGLNITPAQVDVARERVRERDLEDRIDLRVGSATDMPFEAGSFDRVVALESAFHFDTRQDFFREALRVLRPGGVLGTADVVLLGSQRHELDEMEASGGLVATANWCDRSTYAQRMEDAGFVDVKVRPISDRVYPPLVNHLERHLEHLRSQGSPIGKIMMTAKFLGDMRKASSTSEYILAAGTKAGAR